MKVVDIANEIYEEQGKPTSTSIAAIAFWIRSNVGKVNSLLYENFYVDATTQDIYSPVCNAPDVEITVLPAAIIKTMYKVYQADLDIRNMIAGIGANSVIEASDMDFSVKRINKSEVLKTLATIKKDLLKEQTDLVHTYRSYNGAPRQVTGDDTVLGFYAPEQNGYTRNVTMGGGSGN